MRTTFALLSLGLLVSAFLLLLDAPSTRADHTGGGMQAMSIDMEEEGTPANTSSALGTRETCRRINENDSLDGDEDVVDGLLIDVTADGIPPYHDSGTPGDPSDDTGGIEAYTLDLTYSSGNLTIQALEHDDASINILARNAGSAIILVSDSTPDDNADNVFNTGAIDSGSATRESGSGVIVRLTLVTEAGALAGAYALTLSNNAHLDATGTAYVPTVTNNDSYVAVDTACGDFDGDGVADAQDACPTMSGPPSNAGCPPPGPPAVGGVAGLIEGTSSDAGPRVSPLTAIAATLAALSITGGLLARRLAARRIRR